MPFPLFLKVVPKNPFLDAGVDVAQQGFLPVVPGMQDNRLSDLAVLSAFINLPNAKRHVHFLLAQKSNRSRLDERWSEAPKRCILTRWREAFAKLRTAGGLRIASGFNTVPARNLRYRSINTARRDTSRPSKNYQKAMASNSLNPTLRSSPNEYPRQRMTARLERPSERPN